MTTLTTALKPAKNGSGFVRIKREGDVVFPWDQVRYAGADLHDPNIVEFDGTYVMVGTSHGNFVPVWTSKDLLSWREHGPILGEAPNWLRVEVPQHRSIWAPAPDRVGEKFRVYYCASQAFGKNTSFIGFAENASFDPHRPTEGWVDKGMLVESREGIDNFNAIDPDVLAGPDGRRWMVYGSYWSGIYLVELDPSSGAIMNPGKPALHVASNTGDKENALEAPALCFHDGYYYLFVTYGLAAQGVRSTYRMMAGRSESPEGPYLGYDGKPMAEGGHTDILKSSPPMFGPGGGNVFQDAAGEWWMAYHYYDSRRHWHRDVWGKPTLQVRHIVWGPDGWPLPGLPAGVELEAPKHPAIVGTWSYQSDFHDVAELKLEDGGLAFIEGPKGTWSFDEDLLTLYGTAQIDSVQTLVLDKTCQFCVGRDQHGSVIRAIKQ